MKVLTLNYEYPPLGGGAAPVSQELAAFLVDHGHEVDVVTMSYGDLPSRENRRGVNVYRVPSLRASESMSRPYEMATYLLTGFVRARKLVQERDYDVVHAHFIIPTGVMAYYLENSYDVPYVVTAHGSDVPGYNPDRFTLLHRMMLPAWKRIAAKAESVVSPSEHLARLIRSTTGDVNIDVIPNGFDAGRYDPGREKEERILVTSRLFERKGIQYVLEALLAVETDWDVVITGEGPYREPLEQKADCLGVDVSFTGWLDREALDELLETSAIYVFPSSHENCPVALQEAMAAGSAIIASKFGGTRELLGSAGLTVDPHDPENLASALQELLSDPEKRSTFQRAARDRIVDEYDWDRIGSEYLELLTTEATHPVHSEPWL